MADEATQTPRVLDLGWVPIQELVDEIRNRTTGCVIAYELPEHEDGGATFSYGGGWSRCVGLLHRFLWQFQRDDSERSPGAG